jgi:hypothetical protein
MRAAQAPAWIAAMLCTALALDPSFLFAFRTQHYILLLPFVFSAAALLLADAAQAVQDGRRALVLIAASGLLGGIACYGYFVYFAFAPALAWFALANRTAAITRKRTLLAWGTGFAVGISPYPIGLALMVDALGGVSAAFAWLATTTANLKAGIDFGGPLDRVFWFGDQLQSMVTAEEFTRFLFGEQVGQSGAWSKTAFFAVAVLATMASLRAVRRADRIGLALAACLAGLFVLTLIFGRRLMAHHFLPALPILYVLLAIGASRWAQGASTTREPAPRADARLRTVMIVVSAIAVALVALNAVNARSVLERLRQTRGVWLFHESVTRFAEAEARQAGSVFYYFPDWGLFTSFAMITHGKLPFLAEFPTGQARMFLCSGRDVVVATTEGGDRRIADWTTKIGWTEPHIDYHRQRDGSLVFQTSRWFAQAGPRKEQPCPR